VLIDQSASAIASCEEQTDPDEAHQNERDNECDGARPDLAAGRLPSQSIS